MSETSTIYVGDKKVGTYVRSIVTELGKEEEVLVKARGMDKVGKAVSSAELVRNKHEKEIEDITTDTHTTENEDGSEYSVTAISIRLAN